MRILLARHGETDWNIAKKVQGTTDIPLNENGIKQARLLCDNLKKEGVSLGKIYSSYQKRAVTTAEVIASEYHVPVKVLPGLEEMNLGMFEGHTWEEILLLFPEENDKWQSNKRYSRAPGGESYQDLLTRFFVAYDQIMEDMKENLEKDQDILIITHGAVIMSLLTIKNNLDFRNSYTVINVDNAKAITLQPEDLADIRGRCFCHGSTKA